MTTTSLLMFALLLADPAVAEEHVDFDTQIMPILTRSSCNSGSCHGAAAGRGGFRLSLLGANPALDHEKIVHELEGRRINLRRPADSLLITKPTETLAHEGGTRFELGSAEALLIETWIRQGAQRTGQRQLQQLSVSPSRIVLASPGDSAQVAVQATFTDRTEEDVTSAALLTSSDELSVAITPTGTLTAKRPGQHHLIVRYLNRVVPVTVIVPLGDQPVSLKGSPRNNFIDDEILTTLETLRLHPGPQASPQTLRRRLSLDLTGVLPKLNDTRSEEPLTLESELDRLMNSDEFVDYWTWQLARLFRVQSKTLGVAGAQAFHRWLRVQVASNRPLNELVRDMLLADGDSHQQGAANFSRVSAGPREQAEFVSEVLLGSRLRCANCHDHPLDRWTQDDYHGLAAIFAKVDRGQRVQIRQQGEVTHPRTGEPALPKLPGERFLTSDPLRDREELTRWIVDSNNPLFARAMVNRIWKLLMGRGLVEPVDDLRDTNPPTHPELLTLLAEDFVNHAYDLRHLIRRIVSSAAYSRSSESSASLPVDDRFYSRASIKPLPAEVLLDAISTVTGVQEEFSDKGSGTRAVLLEDGAFPSPTLDLLGRCDRTGTCDAPSASTGISTKLHLITGPLLNQRLADPRGRLQRWLSAGLSDEELLHQLYVLALTRTPTGPEQSYWLSQFKELDPLERSRVWEDLIWSLLNSHEFQNIH